MTYTNIPKPTTTFSSLSNIFNYLLINSTDFLLINTVDRLGISDKGKDLFNTIQKPTTAYSSIIKPI